MSSRFQFNVNFSLDEDEFDVNVVNLSDRKGFVDMPALKRKLNQILGFLIVDGIKDLVASVNEDSKRD